GRQGDLRAAAGDDPHANPSTERVLPHETHALAHLTTAHGDALPRYFRTVADWGIQIALALEYAHSVGLVHRDIKPANLILGDQILDNKQRVWITDFGLARFDAGAGLTMTGDLVGPLRYMSPERALGGCGRGDHRRAGYSAG